MGPCDKHAAAFARFGINDGSTLIARTYYVLVEAGIDQPEPNGDFVEQVARAFKRAYIREADVPLVPTPVSGAIEHATDHLAHVLLEDSDQDLRTELLPAFYNRVATAYCRHVAAGGAPGAVGIWYHDDDGDGGIPVERP